MWPFSRKSSPKQFVRLIGDKSLFERNLEAILGTYDPKDILISGSVHQKDFINEQAHMISEENIILEPSSRNTGPAVGLIIARLMTIDPDEPFMFIQTDDLRFPNDKFLLMIREMEKIVKNEKLFITGGIRTNYPIMGVDYMKLGERLKEFDEIEAHKVADYLPRTSFDQTAERIRMGDVVIHTMHYAWTPRLMLEAFKKHTPGWGEIIEKISEEFKEAPQITDKVVGLFEKMEPGSIETVTQNIFKDGVVIKLDFEWVDIGVWESLSKYLDVYQPEVKHKKHVKIDSENVFIQTKGNKMVATIGVDDLAIIDSGDALLVCPLSRTSQVGDIVKKLSEEGFEEYS